jgi:hypothetical protein
VLGLERTDFDGEAFRVRGSAHRGVFTPGDLPTKKHVRTIPLPPSTAELVRAIPVRIDTPHGDSGQTSDARRGADGLGPSGARRSSAVPSGNPRRGIVVADWLWRDGAVADPLHVGVERCRVGLDHLGVVGWVVGLRHA